MKKNVSFFLWFPRVYFMKFSIKYLSYTYVYFVSIVIINNWVTFLPFPPYFFFNWTINMVTVKTRIFFNLEKVLIKAWECKPIKCHIFINSSSTFLPGYNSNFGKSNWELNKAEIPSFIFHVRIILINRVWKKDMKDTVMKASPQQTQSMDGWGWWTTYLYWLLFDISRLA